MERQIFWSQGGEMLRSPLRAPEKWLAEYRWQSYYCKLVDACSQPIAL
jgi:hypothetical protein